MSAMKIRKMAGLSPMPNHRIANGIQARGERLRKKLIAGSIAVRARARWPSHKPRGMPAPVARANPAVTRKSEATTSLYSRPLPTSSRNPFATEIGDGKIESGKRRSQANSHQIAIMIEATRSGNNRVLSDTVVEVILSSPFN